MWGGGCICGKRVNLSDEYNDVLRQNKFIMTI